LLRFGIAGFFQGAVYGLLAVGLVLVYKGTRVFNFAQAEFGTVGAFITFILFQNAHVNYAIAVVVALVLVVGLGLLAERVVIRPLLDAPRLTILVATVGVALFIIAITFIINGAEIRSLAPAITDPVDPQTHFATPFYFFGAGVTHQQLLVLGILLAIAVGLAYFFSRTNTGLAILAVSQDRMATQVVGISVARTSQIIWGLAALLGGIAGILQAGVTSSFFPGFMTVTTLIPAFTAAVVGGMTSLPGAFIGGILVGVVQNVVGTYWLGQKVGVPGNGTSLAVFLLLLLVLLIRPTGLLGKEA